MELDELDKEVLRDIEWVAALLIGYVASYKVYRRLGAPPWAALGFTDIALRFAVSKGAPSTRKRTGQ